LRKEEEKEKGQEGGGGRTGKRTSLVGKRRRDMRKKRQSAAQHLSWKEIEPFQGRGHGEKRRKKRGEEIHKKNTAPQKGQSFQKAR